MGGTGHHVSGSVILDRKIPSAIEIGQIQFKFLIPARRGVVEDGHRKGFG